MSHGNRPWNANTPPQTMNLFVAGSDDTTSGSVKTRIPRAALVTSIYLVADGPIAQGGGDDHWTVNLMLDDEIFATVSNEEAAIDTAVPPLVEPTTTSIDAGALLHVELVATGTPVDLTGVNLTYVIEFEHV